MRSLIALLLSLWLAPAWAQVPMTGAGKGTPAYVGPGDIATFLFWHGFRCYNGTYSGNVADITDAATGNTTGTRLQCANGVVVDLVSGSACTFVTGNACSSLATTCATACNVRTLYDQLGSVNCTTTCNATQTTNANRPTLVMSCVNSSPCMESSGLNQVLANSTGTYSFADPNSFSVVANFTSGTGSPNFYVSSGSVSTHSAFFTSTTQAGVFAGSTANVTGITTATWYSFHGTWQTSSSCALYINASATTGLTCTSASQNITSNLTLGAAKTGAGNIRWAEGGLLSGAVSAGTVTSLTNNQRAYYNF